jgi:hypothetical protein
MSTFAYSHDFGRLNLTFSRELVWSAAMVAALDWVVLNPKRRPSPHSKQARG